MGLEIFIHRKPIDMRFGFHKLTGLIHSEHGMQTLLDGQVFIFFGYNRTRVKVFFFDGTSICLLIKRLEQGRFMRIGDVDFDQAPNDCEFV